MLAVIGCKNEIFHELMVGSNLSRVLFDLLDELIVFLHPSADCGKLHRGFCHLLRFEKAEEWEFLWTWFMSQFSLEMFEMWYREMLWTSVISSGSIFYLVTVYWRTRLTIDYNILVFYFGLPCCSNCEWRSWVWFSWKARTDCAKLVCVHLTSRHYIHILYLFLVKPQFSAEGERMKQPTWAVNIWQMCFHTKHMLDVSVTSWSWVCR